MDATPLRTQSDTLGMLRSLARVGLTLGHPQAGSYRIAVSYRIKGCVALVHSYAVLIRRKELAN